MVDLTVTRPDDTGARMLELVPAECGKASAPESPGPGDMFRNVRFTRDGPAQVVRASQLVADTNVPGTTKDVDPVRLI